METEENQTLLNRRKSRGCCIRCCRSCCVGCVCSKGILLLLTWSVLIHSFGYYAYLQAVSIFPPFMYPFIAISVVQAVVFLLYPVAGLMGEVCLSRFKLMILGTFLALFGIVIAVLTFVIVVHYDTCKNEKCLDYEVLVPACVGLVIYQFGLGLFEANAIQFGTDQLQFAANDRLSVFVNWYFWSLYIIYYIPLGIFSFILIPIMLICCCSCHSHFTAEPAGHINPVKHIFKVLKYARHHSQPVFRSAFTYGEVPSRLDLAKNRYGGPFTTEEVEDVKTFGRIFLLLVSLYGFLLLPNSAASSVVYAYNTDDFNYFILFHINIQYNLPVLVIPVHMLIIRPCFNRYTYRITILNKMGAGLILVVVSSGLMTAVDVLLHNFNESRSPPNYIPLIIIVSGFLNGLSIILIFLSALEFILAQGPRRMQGLLIGLWYAFQSIYVLLQIPFPLLNSHQHIHYWPTLLKTCLAVVSLVVFLIISRWYRYRQREESSEIHQQAVIEEYTERQIMTEIESFDYDSEYKYLSDYSFHTTSFIYS